MRAIRLRTEYRENPLGIDVLRPRLSWALESDRRGDRQTAYQILVASELHALDSDRGDLWDSGRVEGGESLNVEYAGPDLRSSQRCWWKVRAWDRDGHPSGWSEPAWWEMGLLDRSEWKGDWIGWSGAEVPYLRGEFEVSKPVRRARAYATALGLYELHLNGGVVGHDRFAPGWTDYRLRVQYQTYDVTEAIRQGQNAVGAVLAPGWYSGHVGMFGPRQYGERPYFVLQLNIEYEDGTADSVLSDRTWRASDGAIRSADILMGESCDAREERQGWDAPELDDSSWAEAEVAERLPAAIVAQVDPPIRVTEELRPVAVTRPSRGVYVFDMGQNMVGWTRLRASGGAGTKVTLRHAEVLGPDGTLYTENLRTAKQTDEYVLRGDGEEVYEPHFTYHGFRYVEVTGYPGEPSPDVVTGLVAHSAMPPTGVFETSSELLNRLQHNIVWSQRGNFFSVPTDCPQRDERLGWAGDAQMFAATASFNMDTAAFFEKWLRDVEDAQRPDGAFADVAPMVGEGLLGSGRAGWGDVGVIVPWVIYLQFGDRRMLEEHYGSMQRWIEYLREHSRDLIRPAEGYGDWLSVNSDAPKDLIGTAFFAHSTSLVAEVARELGRDGDAGEYERLFGQIREAFDREFVSPDGRIRGDTQTGYVLALHFDLLPEELRDAAAGHLVEDIERRNWHLSTGFLGTPYLLQVLADTGHLDVAYRLLNQDTFPSWGYPILHGATTIWERWDGWTEERGFQDPRMNSFNHYGFGSVGEWMYRNIAGIAPAEPGFRSVLIHPRPGGGLTWARGEYDSVRGRIATGWRLEDGRFSLRVSIPANTTASVRLPCPDPSQVTESDVPVSEAEGVEAVTAEEGFVALRVGSGEYGFSCRVE